MLIERGPRRRKRNEEKGYYNPILCHVRAGEEVGMGLNQWAEGLRMWWPIILNMSRMSKRRARERS